MKTLQKLGIYVLTLARGRSLSCRVGVSPWLGVQYWAWLPLAIWLWESQWLYCMLDSVLPRIGNHFFLKKASEKPCYRWSSVQLETHMNFSMSYSQCGFIELCPKGRVRVFCQKHRVIKIELVINAFYVLQFHLTFINLEKCRTL